VALPADFAEGPKFRALDKYGKDARGIRDLFVQMYCRSRLDRSDGFVSEADVKRMAAPDSPRAGARDAERLVGAGIVERAMGGYVLPEYLDDNPSRETEDQRAQARGEGVRRGNHDRWHVRRNDPDPACSWCQCADQFTEQNTDLSTEQPTGQSTENGDQAVLLEITPPIVPPTGGSENGDDPAFTEFWQVYPRKVGKPRARKAWRLALRRKHDPALITDAAERYSGECDRLRRDPQYIAHPSTWLNDERYLDAEETPAGPGTDDDFWTR
jgi:hypothetical protein